MEKHSIITSYVGSMLLIYLALSGTSLHIYVQLVNMWPRVESVAFFASGKREAGIGEEKIS